MHQYIIYTYYVFLNTYYLSANTCYFGIHLVIHMINYSSLADKIKI